MIDPHSIRSVYRVYVAALAYTFVISSAALAQIPHHSKLKQETYDNLHKITNSTLTPGSIDGTTDKHFDYKPDCDHPKDHDEADICAQNQAIKTSLLALKTSELQTWIGLFGLLGVIATLFYTAKSARSVKEQLLVSRDTLILDQRAWIKTKLVIDGDADITATDIGFSVYLEITNTGKTAAHFVSTSMEIFENSDQNIQRLSEFCQQAKNDHNKYINSSRILFSNDSYNRPWGLSLSDPSVKTIGKSNLLYPIVLGCVTYKTIYSEELYQTAFIYTITKAVDGDFDGFISIDEGTVEKENLMLSVTSGGFAT